MGDLIHDYVETLRWSLRRHRDVDRLAEEVEDHLRTSARRWRDLGWDASAAEQHALASFGDADALALSYVHERRRGLAVPTPETRRAGLLLVAGGGAWLIGLVALMVSGVVSRGRPWEGTPQVVYAAGAWTLLLGGIVLWIGLLGVLRRHGGGGPLAVGALVALAVGGLGAFAPWFVYLWIPALACGGVLLSVWLWRRGHAPARPSLLVGAGPAIGLAVIAATIATVGFEGSEVQQLVVEALLFGALGCTRSVSWASGGGCGPSRLSTTRKNHSRPEGRHAVDATTTSVEAVASGGLTGFLDRNECGLRLAAQVGLAGTVLGVVIGGVGSRIAMRVVFLTSDPRVAGLTSDDGFEIGRMTADSVGLLIVGLIFGALGAAIYLVVRPALPAIRWVQILGFGVPAGLGVGSMIVHPDGVDFTLLGPLWLTVGLFVLIPLAFGTALPLVVDRLDRDDGWFARQPRALALLPIVSFVAFPPAVVVLLVGLVLWDLLRRWPVLRRRVATAGRAVVWIGLGAVTVLGTQALVTDLGKLI